MALATRPVKRAKMSSELSSSSTLMRAQTSHSELEALGVRVVSQSDVERNIIEQLDNVMAAEELAKSQKSLALVRLEIQ